MNYEDNPNSIKYYVKQYLLSNKDRFKNKVIVDFPAGNGVTSNIIKNIGATPLAFDLFPEYFNVENLKCTRAEIAKGIPLENNSADALICQEGIEHFQDQLQALREFNRILKPNGTLLITTPNYSNLRARFSYLLTESERFHSIMPPNELDSIWMSEKNISDEIYFGHIFLIGIQKLRVLAKLSGFKLNKVHPTKIKSTSLILFLLHYPLIYMSSLITYRKNLRKNKLFDSVTKRKVYREIFKLNTCFKVLTNSHLMVEFEKEAEYTEVGKNFKSQHKEFGVT